jgi:hypothetical protein
LLCKEFLALDAASGEGRSLLEATLRRLDESTAGNFDFSDMYNKARNQKYPRLDYGDYIGSVEVRACISYQKEEDCLRPEISVKASCCFAKRH